LRGLSQVDRQARQQRFEQLRLPAAQRVSLAPAEEGAVPRLFLVHPAS
jgi:hypothetical protein